MENSDVPEDVAQSDVAQSTPEPVPEHLKGELGNYQLAKPGKRPSSRGAAAEGPHTLDIPEGGLRISLGCGRHTLDGWFCVDLQQNSQATRALDMVSDIKKLALPDGCASQILVVHAFEHLYRFECDDALKEWKRLLRPKGLLVMEMPDLLKCCKNILENRKGPKHEDQFGLWGLFGDYTTNDPTMVHKWGHTFISIKPLLEKHGFIDVVEKPTQWHLVGHIWRDFRVEARKPK